MSDPDLRRHAPRFELDYISGAVLRDLCFFLGQVECIILTLRLLELTL